MIYIFGNSDDYILKTIPGTKLFNPQNRKEFEKSLKEIVSDVKKDNEPHPFFKQLVPSKSELPII